MTDIQPGVTPGATPQPQGAATAPQVTSTAEINIPKFRFDEVVAKNREYEAKLAEVTKQLEQSAKFKETNAQLQKDIDDLKKGYELEKANSKKDLAINEAIKDKAIDVDVVKKLIDREKISFNDAGEVLGLAEQIKELQTSKQFLWHKPAPIAKSSATSSKTENSFAKTLAQSKLDAVKTTDKAKNYF